MADKLTPQQAQAVHNRGGKLLVSAAAGSGKTKVLVDRLLEYLTDPKDPANLDEFLIITYTKAAASELRGKIAAKLTERIAQDPENRHLQKQIQRLFLTKISTVHGFCGDLLREYTYKLDLSPDFRVADENECSELRQTVLADLLDRAYSGVYEDPDFRAFVDTQGLGRDDRLVPEIVLAVYDSARCHLDPEHWLDQCLQQSEVSALEDASQTVWGQYLIERLQDYLDSQIHVLDRCAALAEACPGMEKAALNLRQTLHQLQILKDCKTWDQIVQNRNIDYGRLTFPRKCPDEDLAERIKAARNACKKGLEKYLRGFEDLSERVLSDMEACSGGIRGLVSLVRRFDKEYALAKRARRCVDFSDLEHKTLDLLLGTSRAAPTAAAREIAGRFREVMVDEYQDSNAVQDAIFSALTEKKNNCFMVGDVKQSIYQFRLADPGIFLEKYRQYAAAEDALPGEGRKVLLSHNFRSGAEVIEAVNHVFYTCMSPEVGDLQYTEAEALREGVPHVSFPDPAVELYALQIREDTYEEEASFVAARIRQMIDNGTMVRCPEGMRRVTAEDIVILLRSPGSVGGHYQRALEAVGIRCASGGGEDLLKTQEIGVLRSLLQTIYNPRLDIPLVSTLASPVFGFTADDLASFRSGRRAGSVYDALLRAESAKCKEFLTVLEKLRRSARMNTLTQLLEDCFTVTGMDRIFSAMPGGETKSANLQIFYQLASQFESGNQRDLGQFLDHLDALEEKGLIRADGSSGGCVNIMSIHKSKGLEFPVVFLCGLARQFNRENTRAQLLCHKEFGLGLSCADTVRRVRYPSVAKRAIAAKMASESLSEELRVLYVAMTRARDRLIMTYAPRNLETELTEIALRMDFDGGKLLCRDAVCPGDWVMAAAMGRLEAGELFRLGGKPAQTNLSGHPWKIRVTEAPEKQIFADVQAAQRRTLPENTAELLSNALAFRYPYPEATVSPSKQIATGRKGRQKDEEAAEHTPPEKVTRRHFRKPSFLTGTADGKTVGTAVHEAMQYIRYENCGDESGVASEIRRLTENGFLTDDQAALVDRQMLSAFFSSSIGAKLCGGAAHLREFKFSILDDGSHYADGLEGEQVLLQGVVDCALLEEDGITILDFKTDAVTEQTLPDLIARYGPQVDTYGEALARIFECDIKAKYLYFFRMNRFVQL